MHGGGSTALGAVPVPARQEGSYAPPVRLWRLLALAWLRQQERRMESGIHARGHDGVLEDFRRASRG